MPPDPAVASIVAERCEEIARELTPARKRAILALDGKEFRFWKDAMTRLSTRMWLTNEAKLTEPQCEHGGAIIMFSFVRLTPLGLAVRDYLTKDHPHGQ